MVNNGDSVDIDLGKAIAQRVLEKNGQVIRVLVGEPRRLGDDDDDDYICPYRIETAGGAELSSSFAAGVDSIQALIFALTKVGDRLSSETDDVTFLGRRDLGLPVTQVQRGSKWTAQITYPTSADNS